MPSAVVSLLSRRTNSAAKCAAQLGTIPERLIAQKSQIFTEFQQRETSKESQMWFWWIFLTAGHLVYSRPCPAVWSETKNFKRRQPSSRGAFCCVCSVNFSLMRETAGMRLRRFSAQESRKKRSRKIRRKTTMDPVFEKTFLVIFPSVTKMEAAKS